jgi:hypothetical protein
MSENTEQRDEVDEIMQMIGDLAAAQCAVDGRVDKFELKKAVLRRIGNIELGDDLALNTLPKKVHRALDEVIDTSLLKLQFDNYRSENYDESLQPIRPLRFIVKLLKYELLAKLRRGSSN